GCGQPSPNLRASAGTTLGISVMQVHLVPLHGGEPVALTKDITLVGRKEGCDLRLEHKSVSKQHCVLARAADLLLLRDLGSTNGTRVNGKRVRRAALAADDKLSVAGFSFRVVLGAPPAEAVRADGLTQHLTAEEAARLRPQPTAPSDAENEAPSPA